MEVRGHDGLSYRYPRPPKTLWRAFPGAVRCRDQMSVYGVTLPYRHLPFPYSLDRPQFQGRQRNPRTPELIYQALSVP